MTTENTLDQYSNAPETLKKLVDELNLTSEQIEKLDFTHRDDWGIGDDCPECGSNRQYEFVLDMEFLYLDDDGVSHFEDSGDRLTTLAHFCTNCDEELATHPLLKLLLN